MPVPAMRIASRAGLTLACGLAVMGWVVLVAASVHWLSSLVIVLAIAWQSLAGLLIWRSLHPESGLLLTAGVGMALGGVLSVLAGLATQVVGLGIWGWAVPSLAGAAISLLRRSAANVHVDTSTPRRAWVGLVVTLGLGLAALAYNLLNYPLAWSGTWSRYHSDMPYFEALSTSLARLGPLDSIFLPGAQVRYHWLVYAWAGQLSAVVDAAPFVVITRVVPLVSLVIAALIVVGWSVRASRTAWVPTVAGALLVLGGFVGAVFGGVLNIDSPSQSLGVCWLLAFSVVLIELATARGSRWLVVLLGVLGFALVGGKVSAAAPALAGALLVAAVAWLRREPWRAHALWGALAAVLGGALAFVLLLAGGNEGGGLTLGSWVDRIASLQGLNPVDGTIGVVAGTAIMLIAIAGRWFGLLWLVGDRGSRWDPSTIYGVGLAAFSLAAVTLLNSFNEVWFATAASAPLAVLSAVGAGRAYEFLCANRAEGRRATLLGVALSAVLVYAVVWWLWTSGPSGGNVFVGTWRWAGPVLAVLLAVVLGAVVAARSSRRLGFGALAAASIVIMVFASVPGRLLGVGTGQVGQLSNGIRTQWFSVSEGPFLRRLDTSVVPDWTDDQMAAARWLRENADRSDLLATNLTFGPFVAGVTGLQTFVSALQYQGPYGRPADIERLVRREAEAWAFIDAPSATSLAPLCDAGVRWLWIDPKLTKQRSWAPFATARHTGPDVIVLELAADACS